VNFRSQETLTKTDAGDCPIPMDAAASIRLNLNLLSLWS